jgi:hypothetical protein
MTSTEFTVGASDRANKILAFDTNGELAVTQELGTYRGNWATATSYFARDLVKDTSTNNIFIVDTAHTSSGSQPLTTNANSAYYELIVDAASASTSATAAAASAATATTQATNAASSASAASSSASAASSSASSASSAVTAAQAAQAAAELALDNFDDIYLGAKASNPTLDNDGGALTAGDLYFNTASSTLQVYSGSAWQTAAVSTAGFATLAGTETFTNKTLTSPIIGTAITLNSTAELRLADTDSSNYVGFKSPGTVSTNRIWTLPSADGSANQALTTNGSGVLSFADAGRTGAVNWDTTAKTTGFTAVSKVGYFCNTTSAAFTVTLPATPAAGDIVAIADYANTSATNNITVGRNGSKIDGETMDAKIKVNGQVYTLIYVDATEGWKTINQTFNQISTALFVTATGGTVTTSGDYKIHSFTGPGTFTVSCAGNSGGSNSVEYLIVAGGGGGGRGCSHGAGAGAGGYRTSPSSPVTAQAYPIVVGAGGAGGTGSPKYGADGNTSSFNAISSAGGGGAGGWQDGAGRSGGSGSGNACNPAPSNFGAGNTPPVSPPQGNPGGANPPAGNRMGGGGGAGEAGGTDGFGYGGDGVANSITGSSVTYAGGGSAGGSSCGSLTIPGGDGGGGSGSGSGAGGDGTANTGGGGGGSYSTQNGGAGGSGIVIIKYKFQ